VFRVWIYRDVDVSAQIITTIKIAVIAVIYMYMRQTQIKVPFHSDNLLKNKLAKKWKTQTQGRNPAVRSPIMFNPDLFLSEIYIGQGSNKIPTTYN